MLSFHNDIKIKAKYLRRVRAHTKADEIVKGKYWEGGKGCAVGCTIHSSDHRAYEVELGIPAVLARLEDRIFENLPIKLAKSWPERFLKASPVGKDLSRIWPQFAIFLLTDKTQCNSRHPQCDIVAQAFRDELTGKEIVWVEVKRAAAAANAAAANAAYDAAYAAAAANAAAYNAAYTVAAYAAAAANAAADAVTYARQKAYIAQSEKLLELLRNIK